MNDELIRYANVALLRAKSGEAQVEELQSKTCILRKQNEVMAKREMEREVRKR
jgi:hypothetical protein